MKPAWAGMEMLNLRLKEYLRSSWRRHVVAVFLTLIILSLPFLPESQRSLADAFKGLKGGSADGLLLAYSGSLSLVAAQLYTVVKRVGDSSHIRKLGGLKLWLNIHVTLSLLGLFFVLMHAGLPFHFKYTALLDKGFAAMATWMLIVASGSGVFGRHLYRRLPAMQKQFKYWRQAHLMVVTLLFFLAVAHMTTILGED